MATKYETGQDNMQVIDMCIKTEYNDRESEGIPWNAMYRPLQ